MQDNVKFAVPLSDGLNVEAVFYGSGTLCVSSQAGCALGCPFCASGSRGLVRNLTLEEMHLQLDLAATRQFTPRRVTISGIGEPLQNPDVVRAFMEACSAKNLPVSLTTTGQPLAQLEAFVAAPHNGLMLSLHGASSAVHRRLVPGGPDFERLWTVFAGGVAKLSRRRRRRIGINYLLLAGINDSDQEIDRLSALVGPLPELTVHLLSCNPVADSPFASPPPERIDEIHHSLCAAGIHARRPNRWRTLPQGGCGTLFVQGVSGRHPADRPEERFCAADL